MALDTGELSTMDATAQAELVRRKELTPLELVDAAIARIERVNPTLNAVIIPLYEDARAAAVSPDLPEGPFRGVPFLLKDIGAMQKGQPYYMGNRALRDADFRSPVDTPLGARFRAAGQTTQPPANDPRGAEAGHLGPRATMDQSAAAGMPADRCPNLRPLQQGGLARRARRDALPGRYRESNSRAGLRCGTEL